MNTYGRIAGIIDSREFTCEECAREYNERLGRQYFVFRTITKKTRRIRVKMEKKKTFKVHVPYIEKDFIVEDWNDSMAVDKVIDTMLTEEERMKLSTHILVDCECEEINPENLD